MYLRPKHAMIVRMSADTFDALDQLADSKKLEVQFGDTPVRVICIYVQPKILNHAKGFTIGDTFYPVKPSGENPQNHELYLRLPNMAKAKVAPLKLHANVMHKLMVERELSRVQETVRNHTLEAEKQRKERKIMYLDKPPDLSQPGPKGKKKDVSTRRPAVSSSRAPALPASSHASSSRASPLHTSTHTPSLSSRPVPSSVDHGTSSRMSPLPASLSNTDGTSSATASTRARLIHCLALKPRTTDDVITLCAGKDPTPRVRSELNALLLSVSGSVYISILGS